MSEAPRHEDNNPYASPQAQVLTPASSRSEETRRSHLSHEANVKTLGALCYLNVVGFLFAIMMFVTGIVMQDQALRAEFGSPILWLAGLSILSVAFFLVGRGLRSLKAWARVPAIAISVIGLLGFPIGTLISAAFLYLLFSKKGQFVFTPEYHAVIAETPDIKYKTSIVAWIALALIIILFLLAVWGATPG